MLCLTRKKRHLCKQTKNRFVLTHHISKYILSPKKSHCFDRSQKEKKGSLHKKNHKTWHCFLGSITEKPLCKKKKKTKQKSILFLSLMRRRLFAKKNLIVLLCLMRERRLCPLEIYFCICVCVCVSLEKDIFATHTKSVWFVVSHKLVFILNLLCVVIVNYQESIFLSGTSQGHVPMENTKCWMTPRETSATVQEAGVIANSYQAGTASSWAELMPSCPLPVFRSVQLFLEIQWHPLMRDHTFFQVIFFFIPS